MKRIIINLINKWLLKHQQYLPIRKIQGKDLIFISAISRDGDGTLPLKNIGMNHLDNDWFKINCLSLTNKTYIASGFNSYVVKLK